MPVTKSGLNIINRLYDNYGEVHWIDFNDISTYTDPTLPISGSSINTCSPRFGDSSIITGTYKPNFETTNRNFLRFESSKTNPIVATLLSTNELSRSIYIVHRYTGSDSILDPNTLFYIGAFDLSNYMWSHRNPIYNIDYSGYNASISSTPIPTPINYIFSSRDIKDNIQNAKLHTNPENEIYITKGASEVASNNGTGLYTSGGDIWLWLGGKPNIDPSNPDDGLSFGDYDIGEVIIVGGYVSDQEDKDIISYLNNKWKDWI